MEISKDGAEVKVSCGRKTKRANFENEGREIREKLRRGGGGRRRTRGSRRKPSCLPAPVNGHSSKRGLMDLVFHWSALVRRRRLLPPPRLTLAMMMMMGAETGVDRGAAHEVLKMIQPPKIKKTFH